MCNSIAQDKRFRSHMPTLYDFFHYRMIDDGVEVGMKLWSECPAFENEVNHRAMDDVINT